MTILRMCIACWIPKATNTHSGCVILIAFPLQQWLQERASMLRYTYSACLVFLLMNIVILLLARLNATFAFLFFVNEVFTNDLKIRPHWVIMFYFMVTERDRVWKERCSYFSKQVGTYTEAAVRSHIDRPPPHLPRAASPFRSLSFPLFPSSLAAILFTRTLLMISTW